MLQLLTTIEIILPFIYHRGSLKYCFRSITIITQAYKQTVMDTTKSESAQINQATQQDAPKGSQIKSFSKKNWDAIIDEFEKEEEKDQGVNDLFKQIYESGNDEVRRAMNKSFQESGGTVLSTNWDNVAKKKVEPKPPSANDDKSPDEVNSLI